MSNRKVILSKDSNLWETGDPAKTLAIVESGKLGVRVGKRLVGIVWPNMVVGEVALFTLEGEQATRTATLFALEDWTTVVEYPPDRVKQAGDEQQHTLWNAILSTLLGQICRNCLVIAAAHKDQPFVSSTYRALMHSLVQHHKQQFAVLTRWEDFMRTFRFLYATRDFTQATQAALLGPFGDREHILKASEITREMFQGKVDVPFLNDMLSAEKERFALDDRPL